jgi:hypothetical protein
MHADFSRFSAEPEAQWTRVLYQQGRVSLDQDLNAQVAIGLAMHRAMMRDLLGPHGAPQAGLGEEAPGFAITGGLGEAGGLVAGAGRYWVEGWPVRNAAPLPLRDQLAFGGAEEAALRDCLAAGAGLVWLEVWERAVSAAEEEMAARDTPWAPGFLEPALGGIETALRARLAWRLHVTPGRWDPRALLPARSNGRMAARARPAEGGCGPLRPVEGRARYEGLEDQLYRVEIHRGGGVEDASWKWSRDNGCVVLPVRGLEPDRVVLWRDARGGTLDGAWVELLDAAAAAGIRSGAMVRLRQPDPGSPVLPFMGPVQAPEGFDAAGVRLLRRWDQAAGSLPVGPEAWQGMERGVEVRFPALGADGEPAQFRAGDHWLIPARAMLGDLLWPREVGADGGAEAAFLPPHGPRRAAAPLATLDARGEPAEARNLFRPLAFL